MARKKAKWEEDLELHWVDSGKRWKKNYTRFEDGKKQRKQWTFPSPHTLQGYRVALAAWLKKKAELDGEINWGKPNGKDYQRAIEERRQGIADHVRYGEHDLANQLRAECAELERVYAAHDEPPPLFNELEKFRYDQLISQIEHAQEYGQLDEAAELRNEIAKQFGGHLGLPFLTKSTDPIVEAINQDRKRRQDYLESKEAASETDSNTIGGLIDLYVAREKKRADNGDCSRGHAQNIHYRLQQIKKLIGTDAIGDLNEDRVNFVIDGVKDLKKSKSYTAGILKTFRDFVNWLYRNRHIGELPRNLSDAKGKIPLTKNVVFTKAELKELLSVAQGKLRLYILLGLNCAMLQSDIANIDPKEVDWRAGLITRKRTKTKGEPNVPTVTYTLWPETRELLLEHGSRKGTPVEIDGKPELRVLTNEKGNLLRDRSKGKKDCIEDAYNKLIDKHKIKHGKTFKHFRSTGADTIAQSTNLNSSTAGPVRCLI